MKIAGVFFSAYFVSGLILFCCTHIFHTRPMGEIVMVSCMFAAGFANSALYSLPRFDLRFTGS